MTYLTYVRKIEGWDRTSRILLEITTVFALCRCTNDIRHSLIQGLRDDGDGDDDDDGRSTNRKY